MGRPKAEVKAEHRPLVDAAVLARQAALAAEEAYRHAVIEAVDDGVVPSALARELGITSQSVRDMLKRRAAPD